MNYEKWIKTWKIKQTVPPGEAKDVDVDDKLKFEFFPDPEASTSPTIQITQFDCTHTPKQTGNNWKGVCLGNGDRVVGFTADGKLFEIVSSTSENPNTLTCKLITSGGGGSGGACWTATDG